MLFYESATGNTGEKFLFNLSYLLPMSRARYLPLAPIGRIIRDAGAERVSDAAVEALERYMEKFALEVGRQAVSLAKHANRKTVSGEDIDLAVRTVWKA